MARTAQRAGNGGAEAPADAEPGAEGVTTNADEGQTSLAEIVAFNQRQLEAREPETPKRKPHDQRSRIV